MRIASLPSPENQSKVLVTLDSGIEKELWIEANVPLAKGLDSWLYLMLPVCMMLKEDLQVDEDITKTAVDSFHKAQDQLLIKHPHFREIKLISSTEPRATSRDKPQGIGSFFSGGLDSTFTLETQEDITSVIGVWGFDIPLKNEKHWNLTKALLEKHSKELNKELILVKTNIRELSSGIILWGRDYHGTALAGIGNSLSNHLQKIYISGSHLEETKRWGQFPSLSKAFSNTYQEIQEHGVMPRAKKANLLGNLPRTTNIRICYRNVSGMQNCGECLKCVRTRMEFDLVNAKYRPAGLERKPTSWELIKWKLNNGEYVFFLDSLNWAKENGFSGTLVPRVLVTLARIYSLPFMAVRKRQGLE